MTGLAAHTSVVPGQILLDKYRVDRLIGQGGMGVVVLATHIRLDERVAMKILRTDAGDDEARSRFVREAQSAVKLKSEYVARVSDAGILEDGSPYMVMEFLEGSDLHQMVETNGKIDPGLAVDFAMQVCEGLAEAHGLGIVHRDIKPSNVFVTWRSDGSPLVKILDFGISRATRPGEELSLTRTASVLGTPAYMSPEQMRSSRRVDHRTDLWSVGVVLYELVEGRWPFSAESFTEMCAKVAADEPDPMTCPSALRDIVMTCLAKDPAKRYGSAGELARALAPLARDSREATLRVERIERTLARRGLGSSTPTAVPSPIANVTSAPISIPMATPPAMSAPIAVPVATAVISSISHKPPAPTTDRVDRRYEHGTTQADIAAPKRSRAPIIGAAILVVIVAAVGAFAVVSKNRGGAEPQPQTETRNTAGPESGSGSGSGSREAAVTLPRVDAASGPDAPIDAAPIVVDAAPIVVDAAPIAVDAVAPEIAPVTPKPVTRPKQRPRPTPKPTPQPGVGSGSAWGTRT